MGKTNLKFIHHVCRGAKILEHMVLKVYKEKRTITKSTVTRTNKTRPKSPKMTKISKTRIFPKMVSWAFYII